jgi:hypothetical protein
VSAVQAGSSLAAAEATATRVAVNRAGALTRRRAENIARTEAMTAANEGKYASWNQQVANGWASPDSVKEWIEGRDPCEECAPLVGEIVPWDQPFSNGQMMPPKHPSCRCTARILPPDQEFLDRMASQQERLASGWTPKLFTDDEIMHGEYLSINGKTAVETDGYGEFAGLPEEQSVAMRVYQAPEIARRVNGELRGYATEDYYSMFPYQGIADERELMARMDLAMEHGTLTADQTLYRGVVMSPELLAAYTPGATVMDAGFMSTSASERLANRFAKKDPDGWVLHVRAHAGQHAAPGFPGLAEVVLPRATRSRVVSVDAENRVIEMEIVA